MLSGILGACMNPYADSGIEDRFFFFFFLGGGGRGAREKCKSALVPLSYAVRVVQPGFVKGGGG